MLREAERDAARGLISKEFVDRYIDRILATPEEDGSLRLEIRIFTGESTEKYLENLRAAARPAGESAGCTGHTFKKMIESYEKSL